jgi:hypothetical protein
VGLVDLWIFMGSGLHIIPLASSSFLVQDDGDVGETVLPLGKHQKTIPERPRRKKHGSFLNPGECSDIHKHHIMI